MLNLSKLDFGASPISPTGLPVGNQVVKAPQTNLPETRDGSPIQHPAVFDSFSKAPVPKAPTQPANTAQQTTETRGLLDKLTPKPTISADEIRLSKAAERDAANADKLGGWNSNNIFLPFPQHH
jgi:hypothetical protein